MNVCIAKLLNISVQIAYVVDLDSQWIKVFQMLPHCINPLDLNHFRPISIISCIAKVFEKLIFNQLSQYVNGFSILPPY